MNRLLLLIAIAVSMALPNWGLAASIKNEDNQVHVIKGRVTGKDWVYVQVNARSTKIFNCRIGCELVLEQTGSAVQLETDADVVIVKGELRIR